MVEILYIWNVMDMQVQLGFFYEGVGYYCKIQFFFYDLEGKCVFLCFEGVGVCVEVYVNGKLVGMYKGGYFVFVCEIGIVFKFGVENEIIVKVDNKVCFDVILVN